MAAFIRGLDDEETLALTRAMVDSGETLPLGGVTRPKVDKHSTGGVADGVTLVFAPLAASLGLAVAKLSGRGLGHTGGTLDKLESIPGLRTDLEPDGVRAAGRGDRMRGRRADRRHRPRRRRAVRAPGRDRDRPVDPADRRERDVEEARRRHRPDPARREGGERRVHEDARGRGASSPKACAALAADWGRRTRCAVTDMSQPLGDAIGNALDVVEALELLRGELQGRLRDAVGDVRRRGAEPAHGRRDGGGARSGRRGAGLGAGRSRRSAR